MELYAAYGKCDIISICKREINKKEESGKPCLTPFAIKMSLDIKQLYIW